MRFRALHFGDGPLLLLVLAGCALLMTYVGLLLHRRFRKPRRPRVSSGGAYRLPEVVWPGRSKAWQRNAARVADLTEAGNYEELKRLLDAGEADPNQKDPRRGKMSSPLLVIAAGKGHEKLAELLIEQPSIDCNLCREDGTTALIMAASRGHERLVRGLLNWSGGRLSIDSCNSNSSTALIVSARAGHASTVKMLIDAGAGRDHAQYTGLTALHFSSREGHLEIVQFLLSGTGTSRAELVGAKDRHGFTPLMYSCQRDHHKVARLLLNNTSELHGGTAHGTALHVAAMYNSCKTMAVLIDSGKIDPNQTDSMGRTALDVARVRRSQDCEMLLMRTCRAEVAASDSDRSGSQQLSGHTANMPTEDFSLKLHSRMLASGFCSRRARFQAGAADLLAEIGNISELRGRFDKRKSSGSFSDGWGSSLHRLNGSLAQNSDVDMSVERNDPVHVEGSCSGEGGCKGAQTHRLENGFLRLADVCGDKPSKTDLDVGVRPSMDFCSYRPCCRCPLELKPNLSKLPRRFQLPEDPEVEFVRSVRPECTDQMEMRISCTSLEKAILRQLSTCQGQVFVIIKYIFKHIISARGLKSYHTKTLMFFLVCEIPESDWRGERLEALASAALRRFELFVESSEEHGASKCMPHFFIPDAWVYFKTGAEADRSAVLRCLKDARQNLRTVLAKFMDEHLRPLPQGPESPFVFQPFSLVELVTPFKRPVIPESGRLTRYQEIYPMVFKILADIGDSNWSKSNCGSLSGDIDSLPDGAATARETLRVLMHLKLDNIPAAHRALIAAQDIQAERCINFERHETTDAASRCVLQQLERSNSAWKFCFYFNAMLDFRFLPAPVTRKMGGPTCGLYLLPGHMLLDFAYFVNFDAVLKVLSLCLLPDRCPELISRWYSELFSAEDANDICELFLFAKFTADPEQLRHCLRVMEQLSVKLDEELQMMKEVQEKLAGRDSKVKFD